MLGTVYRVAFKRTSTFLLVVMAGTFFFERTIDMGSEAIFDNLNKGKQWKDIKHKFE